MTEDHSKDEALVSKANSKHKEEVIRQAEWFRKLRKLNLQAGNTRPDDSHFRKLESSVKKK